MWRFYLFSAAAVVAALFFLNTTLRGLGAEIAQKTEALDAVQRQMDLVMARERSHIRMIERRDAAINASTCKTQINRWIKNPDEVPQPFNPFNQLGGVSK